jgi:hypothetical protein
VSQAGARWGAFILALFCSANISAKEIKQTHNDAADFVGAIGCKSSSCHGGAGPKREQYTIWSRQDFHARAFAILTNARSARLAETIGGGEAPSNARCTVCHSPFQVVSQTRLASTVHPDEGVSCESCHGGAGPWLRGHTRTDWTYAMRVTAGIRDLRSLYVRANTCVACHQNIDNDLLKAGHPTLVFELDSQSINEPKHWKDDSEWDGLRAWLIGQGVALREAAWRARTDANPAPDMHETSVALAWLLARVTAVEPALPKIFELTSFDLEPTQEQADDLARHAVGWKPTSDSAMSILRSLAATDVEFSSNKSMSVQALSYRAHRLVLALDSLTLALNQNRGTPLKIDSELKVLHEDVRKRDDFDSAGFAKHLRALGAVLTK